MEWRSGPGHTDKIIRDFEDEKRTRERVGRWHKWFAWHPVRIGEWGEVRRDRCNKAWLCLVERRVVPDQSLNSVNRWEYRMPLPAPPQNMDGQ